MDANHDTTPLPGDNDYDQYADDVATGDREPLNKDRLNRWIPTPDDVDLILSREGELSKIERERILRYFSPEAIREDHH